MKNKIFYASLSIVVLAFLAIGLTKSELSLRFLSHEVEVAFFRLIFKGVILPVLEDFVKFLLVDFVTAVIISSSVLSPISTESEEGCFESLLASCSYRY